MHHPYAVRLYQGCSLLFSLIISLWINHSQFHIMLFIVFMDCKSFFLLSLGSSLGVTHSFLCVLFSKRHHFSFLVITFTRNVSCGHRSRGSNQRFKQQCYATYPSFGGVPVWPKLQAFEWIPLTEGSMIFSQNQISFFLLIPYKSGGQPIFKRSLSSSLIIFISFLGRRVSWRLKLQWLELISQSKTVLSGPALFLDTTNMFLVTPHAFWHRLNLKKKGVETASFHRLDNLFDGSEKRKNYLGNERKPLSCRIKYKLLNDK